MDVRAGYKKTAEVGEIPVDWEVHPLKDICNQIQDGTHFTPIYVSSGVPFYSVENVTSGDFENTKFVTEAAHNLMAKRCRPARGDILMTRITAGKVGDTKLIDWDCEASIYVSLALLKLGSLVLPEYLYAYSRSEIFVAAVEKRALTNATPKKINLGEIGEIPIAAPTKRCEQQAIAAALSDVDAALAGVLRLIAKKRDLKQAAMQTLLTGQTRLPGFSGEWQLKRLGDHVSFLKNGTHSRAQLAEDGHVQNLHYGDIHGSSSIWLAPAHRPMPSLDASSAVSLERLTTGDLIFVDASEDLDGVGKSVEITQIDDLEVVSGQHTIAARFDKSILADGFKGYLQFVPAFRSHLCRLAAGTKVLATNRAHIASVEMKLPEPPEQKAIAAILSDMDAEIDALTAQADKTRLLKQAMMQELLTGRTRLPIPEDAHA